MPYHLQLTLYCLLLCLVVKAQEADIVFIQQPGSKIILPEGHIAAIHSAKFSPDAKTFITISSDGTAKRWETNTGKLLLDLKKQGEGESTPVERVVFSPDGGSLMVHHTNGWIKRLVQLKTGQNWKGDSIPAPSQIEQFSQDGNMYLSLGNIYDAKTMRLIRTLKGVEEIVLWEGFSPGGKTIISCSQKNQILKPFIRVFDSKSGLPLTAQIPLPGEPRQIRFSANGQLLILESDSAFTIFNANTLKKIKQISFTATEREGTLITEMLSPFADYHLRFSGKIYTDSSGEYPEDRVIYDSISVIHLQSGKNVFARNHLLIGALNQYDWFSPDGKMLLLPFSDSTMQMVGLANGQTAQTIKSWSGIITQARFSKNGRSILTVTPDHIIRSYQTNNSVMVSIMKGHSAAITSACFSPDGTRILTASEDMTARVWEVNTGQQLTITTRKTSDIYGAAFSPDGNKIVIENDHQAITWDVMGGKMEKPVAIKKRERGDRILLAQMGTSDQDGFPIKSADQQYSIQWDHPKSIVVTHLPSGKQMYLWNGEMEHFTSVQISPDNKKLLVTTEYNLLQLLDIRNGKLLFSFVLIDSSNFLVTNGKNHYDGTHDGREMVHYICNGEVIELSQVKEQLWVPGLAERILAGDSINAVSFEQLNICNKAPLIEDISTDSLYRFRIIPRSGGLGKTVLGFNGIEYKTYLPNELIKKGNQYELRVAKSELKTYFDEEVMNQVTIWSATSKGDLPSRVLTKNEYLNPGKKSPPNFFAVMVGTSNYKENHMDLRFAAADAQKMAVTLEEAAGKLLGKEHVFVYTITTDNKTLYPEKGTIRNVFAEISKKASPKDILLIFLSGHGVMDDKTKEFFYLTADASSMVEENMFKTAGISMSELTEWIKPQLIRAGKRVLILDACQSGQAINNMLSFNRNLLTVRGDDEARQIKAIEELNRKSGLYILAASASTELAYESDEFGHGYLTYSLLKQIKENPAILEKGKYLNVTSWFGEAAELVSELAKKDRSRQEPQVVTTTRFNIGIVDEELTGKIQLLSLKPVFVPGNFLNRDEAVSEDNLGIRKMVDTELQRVAAERNIVFAPSSVSKDQWSLNGSYLVRDNSIEIKIRLKKGDETLYSFDMKGETSQLNKLVQAITGKALDWVAEYIAKAVPAPNN